MPSPLPDLLPHRVDIKLRYAFDPHLVTKSGMDDRSARVINRRRAVMIILVCLSPRCPIFQVDYGVTHQTWEAPRDPAYDQVHLRPARPRCRLLRGLFAVALEPSIQISQFFLAQLVEPGLVKLFR